MPQSPSFKESGYFMYFFQVIPMTKVWERWRKMCWYPSWCEREPNPKSVSTKLKVISWFVSRVECSKCIIFSSTEFHDCCLRSGLLHVVKCREENNKMKACMEKWYYNQDFIKECTEQYLEERSEFRRTGISKKKKNIKMEGSIWTYR